MTRAFIVRPFNTKEGIDFERVESELIAPVLAALDIEGRTTVEIARAGNIRTDMFECLLLADVVIADISIHNANVYYELGVRHALRPRTTILIRAAAHNVPFDLQTDRYLEYDVDDPGVSRDSLREALEQSLVADNTDSPVYLLLPALEATDPELFRPVPSDFAEDVLEAKRDNDLPMLAVLGEEAEGFDWGLAASRLVGRAQFDLQAWADAKATWESIRARRPDDPEANLTLGTVFQRLEDPAAAMAAIERVLGAGALPNDKLAEAQALLGRNIKDRWVCDWRSQAERPPAALRSAFLEDARQAYDKGFLADQNHSYSGINALALTAVTVCLARRQPDVWAERFEDDDDAERALGKLEKARDGLAAAVSHALDGETFRSQRSGLDNPWTALSRADMALLTSSKPAFVASAYETARARLIDAGTKGFQTESTARQLRLYLELDLFEENARAALVALGAAELPPEPPPRPTVVVFAGHRIDAPGRPQPRFPPASEERFATMIRDAIIAEKKRAGDKPVEGIAGGASGGDILFHEICAELQIQSRLLLALPKDKFAAESVQDAGGDWVDRFRRLCDRLDIHYMAETKQLPPWLTKDRSYTIWQRNNRWMMHTALSRTDVDITLIVLWDGKGGDGPGGTRDMLSIAESRGVWTVRIDASA